MIDGETCLFVGESWNLKARLLELATVLADLGSLAVQYETCPDSERWERKRSLSEEFVLGDDRCASVSMGVLSGTH